MKIMIATFLLICSLVIGCSADTANAGSVGTYRWRVVCYEGNYRLLDVYTDIEPVRPSTPGYFEKSDLEIQNLIDNTPVNYLSVNEASKIRTNAHCFVIEVKK